MATYAIGDVQGCLDELVHLLDVIHYNSAQDTLWFTGDLINRGPQSLATLRYIRDLPSSTVCVLGNHDLALLAAAAGAIVPQADDTYGGILDAKDKDALLGWLRCRPLLHHDAHLGFTLTHAGIYPLWDLNEAASLAKEVEQLLQGPHYLEAMHAMFGDLPATWHASLAGWDRFRFIVNALTRMRFCDETGTLDLGNKTKKTHHQTFFPWFKAPHRKIANSRLIFGHWAALQGQTEDPTVFALDTGCVWGHSLTALCLETEQRFQVACRPPQAF